jgi:hypothetical protein
MRRVSHQAVLSLLLTVAAAAEGPSTCTVRKGLYDEWLAASRRATSHNVVKDALLHSSPAGSPDPAKQLAVGGEYRDLFRCLSDTAEQLNEKTAVSFCDQAGADRLGLLVCQSVLYLKTGRTASKDFVNAFPAGRKGAEMIWDLEAIGNVLPGEAQTAPVFQPNGPAFRLIDELFLLVLDDKENAAAKYFNIAAYASDTGAKHMDEQIKVLLQESPAVVVKQWEVLRQYQPKLKKLLADMVASLPPEEIRKMRRGVARVCPKDNLDCPEILKLLGRAD